MNSLSAGYLWRVFAAGFSYILFGVGAALPGMYIALLSLLPFSREEKRYKTRRVIRVLCRFYIGCMQWLGLYRYRIDGQVPKDLSGHIVIANHGMLIDALFVLAYVDNVCCIVKSNLANNPFTRFAVASAGYLKNDDEFLNTALRKLEAGENILIFPEGTRNSGNQLLGFRRGAANLAIMSGAPVLPILLCSSPAMLGKEDAWYQLPLIQPRVTMRFFPPLVVAHCIDTLKLRTIQYRQFTRYLHNFYEEALRSVEGDVVCNEQEEPREIENMYVPPSE